MGNRKGIWVAPAKPKPKDALEQIRGGLAALKELGFIVGHISSELPADLGDLAKVTPASSEDVAARFGQARTALSQLRTKDKKKKRRERSSSTTDAEADKGNRKKR